MTGPSSTQNFIYVIIFLMLTFFFPVVVLILIFGNPQMSNDFGPISYYCGIPRRWSISFAKKCFEKLISKIQKLTFSLIVFIKRIQISELWLPLRKVMQFPLWIYLKEIRILKSIWPKFARKENMLFLEYPAPLHLGK